MIFNGVLIKMHIKIITLFDKTHLILAFVKKGKICLNKTVHSPEFLSSRQLYDDRLEFSVVNYLKLSLQLLKLLGEHTLESTTRLAVTQIPKPNLLYLHLQTWRLRITLFMKCCESSCRVLAPL